MSNLYNKTIRRQGELLLNRSNYAYALIVLFAGLPLMTWLSVAIAALITLRKGAEEGLKATGWGILGLLLATLLSSSFNVTNCLIVLLTFIPCFLSAWLLRVTAKWDTVTLSLVAFVSLLICFFFFYPPDFLVEEYHSLKVMIERLQSNGVELSSIVSDKSHMLAYLLGIQALSFVISLLSSLMLARAFQAKLFYPTGFREEMLALNVHPFAVIPFLCIMAGLYWHAPLALALSPIWVLYTASAGVSVLITLFASHRIIITLSLLIIASALLPIVMLPILVSVGLIDSLVNFRTRFITTLTGNKKNSKE